MNRLYWNLTYYKLLKNLIWVLSKVSNKESYLFISRYNLIYIIILLTRIWVFSIKQCIDLTVIDYPNKVFRFYLVYSLVSLNQNKRVYLTTNTAELVGINSLMQFFSSIEWSEREVWDMFGIFFIFHMDLRRILTDYGFRGHPLRKDFPLTGFYEVRYSEKSGRIILEDLELAQSYRAFRVE